MGVKQSRQGWFLSRKERSLESTVTENTERTEKKKKELRGKRGRIQPFLVGED
jgi:hypothetical protein